MIEPYKTMLIDQYPRFSELGFELISDSDFQANLKSDNHKIGFFVGQYVAADFEVNFLDQQNEIFYMWAVRTILDNENLSSDMKKLSAITDKYGLHNGKKGKVEYARGIEVYTVAIIDLAIEFIRSKINLVDLADSGFRKEYIKRFKTLSVEPIE